MSQNQETTCLAPDDAFAALGNETRIQILRELGAADGALSFSGLYDRIDLSDSAQFNYHLDKLLDHFVRKTDAGYALGPPGRQVIEAILSGAVTHDPELERTAVEDHCQTCGRELEIQWQDGSVEMFCSDCEGRWERSWGRVGGPEEAADGYLGRLPFPPAGMEGRRPVEIFRAAYVWTNLELLAVTNGLCPRCAATVETELSVCENHNPDETPCSLCGTNFAVRLTSACTNCIYSTGCAAAWGALPSPELLTFLFDHDINPLAPVSAHRMDLVLNEYDETIESTDPFRATLEFTVDDDSLRLTVDRNLDVLEHAR
jgi:hypothetical protein